MCDENLCFSCKYATWDSESYYGTREEMYFVDGCLHEHLIDPDDKEEYEENRFRDVIRCPEYCEVQRSYYDDEE